MNFCGRVSGVAVVCLLNAHGCATVPQPEPVPAYPLVKKEAPFAFEMTRIRGELPEVGQLSDIAYVGDGLFEVAGAKGMFFFRPVEGDRYELGDVIMYDPQPTTRIPAAFELIDLDADGRLEVLTRVDVLTGPLVMYDETGVQKWTAAATATGPAFTQMAVVVQADKDAAREVLQVFDYREQVRLIQHDGQMDPLTLPNGKQSLWEVTTIDVDADGVDELLWAIHESIVLWSFTQGELARIDLKTGRAFEFNFLYEQPVEPDTYAWRIGRFNGNEMGQSVLTLQRSDGTWSFDLSEFRGQQLARVDDSLYPRAQLSPDGRLWAFAVWGQRVPRGETKAVGCGVIRVGLVGQEPCYIDAIASDPFPPKHNKATDIVVNPDAPFPLEAWGVYGTGISRLRVTQKPTGALSD